MDSPGSPGVPGSIARLDDDDASVTALAPQDYDDDDEVDYDDDDEVDSWETMDERDLQGVLECQAGMEASPPRPRPGIPGILDRRAAESLRNSVRDDLISTLLIDRQDELAYGAATARLTRTHPVWMCFGTSRCLDFLVTEKYRPVPIQLPEIPGVIWSSWFQVNNTWTTDAMELLFPPQVDLVNSRSPGVQGVPASPGSPGVPGPIAPGAHGLFSFGARRPGTPGPPRYRRWRTGVLAPPGSSRRWPSGMFARGAPGIPAPKRRRCRYKQPEA